MKCPYLTNTVTTYIPSSEDVDYPAEITNATVIYPTECLMWECGAYQDGHCVRTA